MNNLPTELLEIIFNNLTTEERVVAAQVSKRFFDINLRHIKHLHRSSVCEEAAKSGNLECLKYAHENGCHLSQTQLFATRGCHFDCIKYAHENGRKWDDSDFIIAVKPHLKYLVDTSCMLADWLKEAHENGCEWDDVESLTNTLSGMGLKGAIGKDMLKILIKKSLWTCESRAWVNEHSIVSLKIIDGLVKKSWAQVKKSWTP
jgi:hypothetical protein